MSTSTTHVWFCPICQRKGEIDAGSSEKDYMMFANSNHDTSSPSCTGDIIISTSEEASQNFQLKDYKDWLLDD